MFHKNTLQYSTSSSPQNQPDDSRLRALLSPMTLEEFRTKFWPDELMVVHGPLKRLPPPFGNAELASLGALFSRYTGRVLFGKGTKGPRSIPVQQVNPAHLYAMGLSLYLPDLEPALPGATAFLRELEKSLGVGEGDTQITAWASPGAEGIACHFDPAEVISIQLHGIKRFYVSKTKAVTYPVGPQFGPHIPALPVHYMQSPEGFPNPDEFEFTEIEMKPGSVLFIPRGVWHRTEADQDSLSVSINITPKSTGECLLRELHTLLIQDPDWRRPIYGASTPEALERIRRLLETLPEVVKAIRAQDLMPQKPPARPESIQPDTRFQRAHDATMEWEEEQAQSPVQVRIRSGNEPENAAVQISVPHACKPLLKWVEGTRRAFAMQELMDAFTDTPLAEQQRVLYDLVRAKFLQRLWYRPLQN